MIVHLVHREFEEDDKMLEEEEEKDAEEREKEALILLGSLCASPWAGTLPHELREAGLFLETQQ